MAPALAEAARAPDVKPMDAELQAGDMEQMLVDLDGSDLAQADLLTAMKSFEGSDFPLPGFDLPEPVEVETDEDKIVLTQARIERRCAFLLRRLRILQARAIGKRISEEVGQSFERCLKGSRRDGCGRPVGLKAFLKRVETTAALQANAASRSVSRPTYYRAECSGAGDVSRAASVGIPAGTLAGLEDTAGALRSHLSVVKHALDSDATESSSGAESNDEDVTYNNQHQNPMPIEKRALWSWQVSRASIASKWVWLQLRLQELEYKIRQHTDLHQQVRIAKGPVEFEGETPSAYEGPLPGSELADNDPALETCARIRPLKRETFKKRKLLQMINLHMATDKAAKPSDIRCSCSWVQSGGCAVCTGRADACSPAPPPSSLSTARRLARLQPSYHPTLSDMRDVSPSVHLAALSSRAWFRSRSVPPAPAATRANKKHPTKLKRGRPPLSRKIRDGDPDFSLTDRSRRESRVSRVTASYDIDNIVIPQSVAAATRPEILHYKEILTPKWRVLPIEPMPLNNGFVKNNSKKILVSKQPNKEEDVSTQTILCRHSRAETAERVRYLKPRPRRSQTSLPAQPPPPILPAPLYTERVKPFTPRKFPLSDLIYSEMLSDMPRGHRADTPPKGGARDTSRSPLSPSMFVGDDPDDAEWEPDQDKVKKRHNIFR